MKEEKNHLDIDLEFLDKKESPQVAPKQSGSGEQIAYAPRPVSTGYKWNRKNILIILGVIGLIIWAIASSSPSDTTTTATAPSSSTSNQTVQTGQYMCSQYDSDQADSLDPDLNGYKKQNLSNQKADLLTRSNALDAEKGQLESEYVDETDQSVIDAHNAQVDSYNYKLQKYQTDQQNWSDAVDAYNAAEKPHDDYLIQHCRPQ